MKSFIYKLLSKGLLLVVLLSAAAAYYYRATLFPELLGEDPVVTAAVSAPVVESEATQSDKAASSATNLPVATNTENDAAVVAPDASNAVAQEPVEPMAADATDPEAAPQTSVASVSEDQAAEHAQSDRVTPLMRARHAYWTGRQDVAIAGYREAIASSPDDPDPHGELGNLYFSQGKWEAAAQAYLDAGHRLIAQGKPRAAAHLVRVLRGLDPVHAQRLSQALRQAQIQQQNIVRP